MNNTSNSLVQKLWNYSNVLRDDGMSDGELTYPLFLKMADSDNLSAPGVIAQEIVEDLQAALEQFKLIAADMGVDVEEVAP